MGGKDKSEITTIIKNELDIEITTETNNINKIVNNSSQNIVTEMSQAAIAQVKTSTNASNTLTSGALIARGGAKVDISQSAEAAAENKAIISIVMSADSMQELGNKIVADVTSKVANDQAAQQSMKSLASIGEMTKSAGGPEAMVSKIADMVGGMTKSITGGSTDTSSRTEITNSVKSKLKSITTNSNDITNAISTTIKNSISQAAEARCDMNTGAGNIIDIATILADGAGSEIKIKQEASVKALNNCIINLNMGSKIANALTQGFENKTLSETANKQKGEQELKSESEITKKTIQESAIMDSVDNLVNKVSGLAGMYMFVVGFIIVAIIGGIFYLFSSGSISTGDFAKISPFGNNDDKDNDDKDNDNEQEGGENILFGLNNPNMNSNIYLFGAIMAMVIFSSRKSIPLCGVFLVVVFLYFVYKKNPYLLDYLNKI
jgi:hypothetical protein